MYLKEGIKVFFNKKNESSIYNPVDGNVKFIDESTDPVFAQKLLGDGFIVEPKKGSIYSPVNGRVTTIFPTKHAIGLTTSNGDELLLHMGINTVEMKGDGFEIFTKENELVTQDTLLAEIDINKIKQRGYSSEIIVVITNNEKDFVVLNNIGILPHSKEIGSLSKGT
ncbi:PTS glucose transporter subunit IIA [Enterococcus casseliflavus]